jgi:hypothetical protein
MSQSPPTGYVQTIELSDVREWPSQHAHEGIEPTTTANSPNSKEQLVPLDLEGKHLSSSSEFGGPSTPRSWSEWLDKALRINKSAVGITRARAVTLVSLSFFFILTTSLLVTGFQGLLPALIKDGVRTFNDFTAQFKCNECQIMEV